ncbi:hypothetical protein pb186bvf_020563 [Paramecium bursaria]
MSQLFTAVRLKPGETKIQIQGNQVIIQEKLYAFDRVLQQMTELPLQEMISQFNQGLSQAIFFYGQTGSGKTYSVQELLPRLLQLIYNTQKLEISCSVLQIYNEKILDMLYKQQLKIRYKNKEFEVENLTKLICHSPEEMMNIFQKAYKKRIINSHALNDQSSRSHCVYTIHGKCDEYSVEFNIIDLAGSERLNQTKVTNISESTDINKSLFYLRLVIHGLADQKPLNQIPYRSSKLTTLLRKSLQGRSNIVMVICLNCSDESLTQSQQSAQYGVKAKQIILHPTLHYDEKVEIIKNLRRQVKQLEEQLSIAREQLKIKEKNEKKYENRFDQVNLKNDESILKLLKLNQSLREQLDKYQSANLIREQQLQQLNNENQDLRDKIIIFEDIISEDIKRNKDKVQYMDWKEVFLDVQGSSFLEIIINKLIFYQRQQKNRLINTFISTTTKTKRSFSISRRDSQF